MSDDHPFDVLSYATGRGWSAERRELAAAAGGLEACLLPCEEGFRFVIDPAPTPTWAWASPFQSDNALFRFRLAHELGHTFFYRAGRPPSRQRRATAEEEAFCDEFAAALLLPPGVAHAAVSRGAKALVEVARRFNTPIDAALRSATSWRPFVFGGYAQQSWQELTIELVLGHVALPRMWASNEGLCTLLATNSQCDPPTSFLVLGGPDEWSLAVAPG